MFDTLIGQSAIKNKLKFYAKGHAMTQKTPFLIMEGAKGLGKTHFARAFSKELKLASNPNKNKPFMEINCSTIGSLKQFLETLYVPAVMGNEMTLLFDECHQLDKKLETAFLSILNTEKSTLRVLRTADGEYPFDFKQLTFIFATTEPDQVFEPLMSRLKRITFANYTEEELGEILELNLPDVEVSKDALKAVASTLRGNARDAVSMAGDIDNYCEIEAKTTFDLHDWGELRKTLDVQPLGLTFNEVQVLQLLHRDGPKSLQALSASTGLSRRALQREVENYLLARGLMDINTQRHITEKGVQVLAKVEVR